MNVQANGSDLVGQAHGVGGEPAGSGEMHHPFLVGEHLYLRGIEPADLQGDYFQWLNDYDVTRFLESGRFPNTVDAMASYYAAKAQSTHDVLLGMVDRKTNAMIGTIKLGSINWIHRTAEFGIMIGNKAYWGKGYGPEATRLLLDYGFRRLNLHKVILGVVATHTAAIRSYAKVGFRLEGRISECLFVDGAYHDKVIMGITRAQFEAQGHTRDTR